MKVMNGSGKPRLRVLLSVAAIAIAGSLGAVASPAQAAEPDHCVLTLPEQNVKCFATYEEAKAYVHANAEVGPEKEGTGTAARRAQTARAQSALAIWPVLITTFFDLEFYNPLGGSLWIIGLGGPCTTSLANVDYSIGSFSARWNNDISSYLTYSNCWVKLFDLPGFGGASTAYRGSQPTLGWMNNDASSARFS